MRFTIPALVLAALAVPAVAQSADEEVVSVKIEIADADLSTEQGRAVVEQRIEASIRAACKTEAGSRYRYGRKVVDESCVADARAEALAEIERMAANDARGGGAVAAN